MRIDGKAIAQHIFDGLKTRVDELKKQGIEPNLSILLIGEDPASKAYVNQKELKAAGIGAQTNVHRLPESVTMQNLLTLLHELNESDKVHGIIVQRPLPKHIDPKVLDATINPDKDVDGFRDDSPYPMPLANAVLKILDYVHSQDPKEPDFEEWLASKNIVIIGKGETGGRPIIQTLKKMGIEPQVVDSKTANPKELTQKGDIIVCAVGKRGVVTKDMIKKGVLLVSIGLHKGADGKLHGDYEEKDIEQVAAWYTPSPGGVGPVNVACLLENLVSSAEKISHNS